MSYVETNTEIQNTVFKINIHGLYRVAKYLNNMQMTSGENRSLKVRGQGSGTKWPWLKLLSLIENSSSRLWVFPWVETFQLEHSTCPVSYLCDDGFYHCEWSTRQMLAHSRCLAHLDEHFLIEAAFFIVSVGFMNKRTVPHMIDVVWRILHKQCPVSQVVYWRKVSWGHKTS